MTRRVGIFVFDDVEVLDFAGPYEVFTTASRVQRRRLPAAPAAYEVFTVGPGAPGSMVRARAGLRVQIDHGLDAHPPIDLLIVPGGVVAAELARPAVAPWLLACAARAELTASVCTGAFLLAQAGLLAGRCVTTHWEDIAELRALHPQLVVLEGRRWVDEGAVVTSAGISAGIDMSLHLVERTAGRELALATARQMEFDWTPDRLAT
ncbi:DJ-1/PfpI family protein [Methylibium sp.]|uniref:DJ-1/PfpI family protein n=1 Tax=Methylibium sp. TaxID=2067992 RepID=UPI003D151036